jgi:hypothetical protein
VTLASGDWLVHGWVIGTMSAPSCPASSVAVASDGSQYGCWSVAYLTDTPAPLSAINSSSPPVTAIQVQNGAYSAFAPSLDTSNLAPEQATFLVRTVAISPCSPYTICPPQPADYHWEIVARIDPWPVPALP